MAVGILFSRGCKEDKRPSNVYFPTTPKQNKTDSEKKENNNDYPSYDGGSGFSQSSSYTYEEEVVSPPALLTKEDKAKMKKKREESRRKLRENADIWLKSKTNDPSLSIQTLEKYKIKSHQGFTNGTVALRSKDYNTAIKYFNETVKDKDASAVTKYFALSNMMVIAQKTKDIKLYLLAARMSALLCATEDLSALGIPKSNHQLEWVEKVENTILARNDKKYFEKCVQLKMDFYGAGVTREDAEADVREDIAFYTDLYKEMLE